MQFKGINTDIYQYYEEILKNQVQQYLLTKN